MREEIIPIETPKQNKTVPSCEPDENKSIRVANNILFKK
jgi:hypothetical protein